MKRRIRATHVLLAAALAAPALLLGAQAAGAAEASWTLETVPPPSGLKVPNLRGVSCPSATECMAVGGSGVTVGKSFAEQWNGTTWTARTVADTKTASLGAVSCSSARACTTVGSLSLGTQGSDPLAERWNGTGWTAQRLPAPSGGGGNGVGSVSCPTATTCVAVGAHTPDFPLAETWNGTTWSDETPPVPGDTLNQLTAVSCLSATSCIAVGVANVPEGPPYADSWNGKSWTLRPVPLPTGGVQGQLLGVSCGASSCQAVGYYSTAAAQYALADKWNGTSWTAEKTAPLGASAGGILNAVSCTHGGQCTAVGGKTFSPVGTALLDEYWDGTKWVTHPIVTPPGAKSTELTAVSCVTSTNCQVVGYYKTSAGTSLLAEQGS